MHTRPVWAEVSLKRLRGNFAILRAAVEAASPGAGVLAVVKGDAYGHGVGICGPALVEAGAEWLGVTSVEEGARLRRALGVLPGALGTARILVMSGLWEGEAETLLDLGLTPQVWEGWQLEMLERAARRRGAAPGSVAVHLEIDTGMARQGVRGSGALAKLVGRYFRPGSVLRIEGVMTHFSAPECLQQTDAQMAWFGEALEQLRAAEVRPEWVHAGNSATALDAKRVRQIALLGQACGAKGMVRPGLALYGYPPRAGSCATGLEPVLAWKSRVTSVREVADGDGVGYESVFRATRLSRLALIPVGYADGLNRLLSSPVPTAASAMLVRERRVPIAGRVSMDQTVLDVTGVDGVAVGDEVVLLGTQGEERIDAWEHAELCGTIPYEVLCGIAGRVARVVCGGW